MTVLPKSLQDNPALGRWLSFDSPGRVALSPGKVELGQGVLTALAQIAAEALALPLDRVVLRPADTARSPNEGFTAGSLSIEVTGAAVALACAQARAALLAAAAARLGCDVASLSTENGTVLRDGAPAGLDLWAVAEAVDWDQPVQGGAAAPWRTGRVLGTSAPRADLAERLGRAGFIHDLSPPGLIHARVVRQPHRLARLARLDEEALARRHPQVEALRRGDFLALLATDEEAVRRAQEDAARFVTWEEGAPWRPGVGAPLTLAAGPPLPAAPAATNALSVEYARGPIAHASIAPSCGLALWDGALLTVWTHSQGVFPLRDQIARVLGLPIGQVRVIHAPGAGCYGHNGADDAALDAALLARERPGRPVRVQWSREDELSRAPFGAPQRARVEASLAADGRIECWAMSVASAPHAQRPGFGGHVNLTSAEAIDPTLAPAAVEDLPSAAGGGASRNALALYDFPQEARVAIEPVPFRTSSLRSLGAHLNVVAIEGAMDELAAMAGADPVAFRLAHLSDPRARRVLEAVATMAGWRAAPLGEGRALGIGLARYKGRGAWCAAVAEVRVDEEARAERLWLACDAGFLVNPAGARAQIEGGAIQAASWTLKEEVGLDADGRVPGFGWDGYPILRFSEVPEVETRFLSDEGAPPLGAGEAAQGPVSAAIVNAASRALGARLRRLPLTRDGILAALAGP